MATKPAFLSADQRLYGSDLTLDGKLVTSEDSMLIGPNDFQTLTNMRYTDTHPKAIPGMTKINSTALTASPNIVDAHFQYREKYNDPHLYVQAYNAGKTLLNISQMTNAPPATGNFSSTVLKNLVLTWVANTAKIIGDFVFPTTANGYYYECITAGTTHATTEPTWSTTEDAIQTDGTVVWLCRYGDASGRFANTQQGHTVFCNGRNNYIYSGDETSVGSMLSISPDDSSVINDFTDIANNPYADSNNIITIPVYGGGIDANTKVLLTAENGSGNATDTSGNSHTFSKGSGVTYSTTNKKFGTYGFSFDGTSNAYLKCSDHADFDLSGGKWTIDTWIRCTNYASSKRGIYMTCNDTDNQFYLYITQSGRVNFIIETGNAIKVSMITEEDTININTWQHIEVGEDDDEYYLFVDGILRAQTTSTDRPLNYTREVEIGRWDDDSNSGDYFIGQMDEIRLTVGAIRHTASFSPPASAYSTSSATALYFGSPQCLDRLKFYLRTVNTTASISAVNYWDGSAWTAVSNLSDSTASGGKTLIQTGTLSWDTTETTAKQRILNNNLGYWYQVIFTGIDDTTSVYKVTCGYKLQILRPSWDGAELACVSFMKYDTSYSDYTINVFAEDYVSVDAGTYAQLGSTTSAQHYIVGFNSRVLGLDLSMISGYLNSNASVLSLYYYNGATWEAVTGLSDGTATGGITLSKSGIITWNEVDSVNEKHFTPNNGIPLYYYKLVVNATLSTDVYLDMITGIPVQEPLNGFNVPIVWLNSLFLCGEKYGIGNKLIAAEQTTDNLFNGAYSFEGYLGDQEQILAGCTLYARYSSALHETMLLLKKNSSWLLDGNSFNNISAYQISNVYGIAAPRTLKVCDLGYEIAEGINKAVAIWQTNTAVVMYDNNSIIDISKDISNIFTDMFDTSKTDRINYLYADKSYGFYDPVFKEYHLLFHKGTSTSINAEYVYDIERKKWYFTDRGTKDLQCGVHVHDIRGDKYTYGILSTGYVERINYGNSFDGDNIVCTLRTPDKPIGDSLTTTDRIRFLKITGKVSDSDSTVTVKHYADTKITGTTIKPITQKSTALTGVYRLYQHKDAPNIDACLHSIELTITAADSQCCFEPLSISLLKKTSRQDT